MKYLIIVISLIATIIFTYLAWKNKNWESIAASIASIATLLSTLYTISSSPKQNRNIQSIGNNSMGIQAGRDVIITKNKEDE